MFKIKSVQSALSLFLTIVLFIQMTGCSATQDTSSSGSSSGGCSAYSSDVTALLKRQNELSKSIYGHVNQLAQLTGQGIAALDAGDYAKHDRIFGSDIVIVAKTADSAGCEFYANTLALKSAGVARTGRADGGTADPAFVDPLSLALEGLAVIALIHTVSKIVGSSDPKPTIDTINTWIDARTKYLIQTGVYGVGSEGLAKTQAQSEASKIGVLQGLKVLDNMANVVIAEGTDQLIFTAIGKTGHAVAKVVCSLKDGFDVTTYWMGDNGKLQINLSDLPSVAGQRVLDNPSPSPQFNESGEGKIYISKAGGSTASNIPGDSWNFRIYGDGYKPLKTTGVSLADNSSTTVPACPEKIEGSTSTAGFPRTYSGSGSFTLPPIAGSCTVGTSWTVTLNADGSVNASTTIPDATCGTGSVFANTTSLSGTHSGGSFSINSADGNKPTTGTYNETTMTGSGSQGSASWSFAITRN